MKDLNPISIYQQHGSDTDRMLLLQADRYVRRMRRVKFHLHVITHMYGSPCSANFSTESANRFMEVSANQLHAHLAMLMRREQELRMEGRLYVTVWTDTKEDQHRVYVY